MSKERIYLQDDSQTLDPSQHEITWSENRIDECGKDTEYVRADLYAKLQVRLTDNHTRAEEIISAREAQIERLQARVNELESRPDLEGFIEKVREAWTPDATINGTTYGMGGG